MAHPALIRFDTPLIPSSPYYFGEGVVREFPRVLKEHAFDRCFLVSSPTLMELFGQELLEETLRAGVRCETVAVGEGEGQKSWEALADLCETLVARGATKDSVLIALGGGVVGNLVGLASALIFRGIRYVEVPTSVMAQTDSTLSNKQAINGRGGKNHFGVYHAPLFIWSDASYPRSEPVRQRRAGVVEGIKNVLISRDSIGPAMGMLELWEKPEHLPELLHLLIQSKLPILRQDPTERAYGMVLEYGHTFGHAIEFLSRGTLFHGEAIAIGMCLAAELSHALGHMDGEFLQAHYHLLGELLGAPTRLPAGIQPDELYATMVADNKRSRRGLAFLLLKSCGQFVRDGGEVMVPVAKEVVTDVLRRSAAAADQARALTSGRPGGTTGAATSSLTSALTSAPASALTSAFMSNGAIGGKLGNLG